MTKVFIDAGHGGKDPGATGNGLQEKNLTLSIALKIRNVFTKEYSGVSVKMSRTRDQTRTLQQRTDMANTWGADYLLSVHINSGGGTGWENYIYNGGVSNTTKQMQDIFHDNVMKELSRYGVRDRGMKRANFHMLRESRMPASLSENLFIDTVKDAQLLKDNNVLESIARGHVNGLVEGFGLKKNSGRNTETSKPTPNSNVLRKGDRGDRVKDLQQKLHGLGYDLGAYGVDGKFGDLTENAVRQFQRDCGLTIDGLAGPQTFSALNDSYERIEKGSRGPAARGLQNRLIRAGYKLPRYGADGIAGNETIGAVKQLQRDAQIAVDGIVGPQTRAALADRLRKL